MMAIIASLSVYLMKSQKQLGYSGFPYVYTENVPEQGAAKPLSFGWPVNGSLLKIESATAERILDMSGGWPGQFLAHELWVNQPTFNFIISDPAHAAVACLMNGTQPSMQYYLLINGTKMPFAAGPNQTYSFGIDMSKVVYASQNYLDAFETSYTIPWPTGDY